MKGHPKPLYEQIKDRIRAQILKGELKADELAPSEAEIIQHYGVSSITARRCLNDLENEGYVTRIRGRGTFVRSLDALAAFRHVGLFYHELMSLSGSFVSHASGAILAELRSSRFEPDLLSWAPMRRSPRPSETLVELTRIRNVDGCIILSPAPADWLNHLAATGMPVVSFGFSFGNPLIASLLFDYEKMILEREKRLLNLGHEYIAVFQEYMDEVTPGLVPEPRVWNEKYFNVREVRIPFMQYHQVRKTIEQMVNHPEMPTLYYVYDYELALYVRQALNDCGVQVPKHASIIVCGNAPGPTRFELEEMPTAEMGRKAAQLVTDALQGAPWEGVSLRFPVRRRAGQTLAAAPKRAKTRRK